MFRTQTWAPVLALVLAIPSFSQSTSNPVAIARDPQAITLAETATRAVTGGVVVGDITLSGSATFTSGSDVEEGSVTLSAMGKLFSKMVFNSSAGTRTEIRNLAAGGNPQGVWVGTDGTPHPVPTHNSFTDAVWFFPAMGIMSHPTRRFVSASYIGQDTKNGASVQHVRLGIQYPHGGPSAANATALVLNLSGTDIYLDMSSSLPGAVVFNTHPDNNALVNIPVEVDFSNYEKVNGVQIPFQIKRLINGVVQYDITIQSASVNSGLTAANFTAQ